MWSGFPIDVEWNPRGVWMDSVLTLNGFPNGFEITLNRQPMEFEWFPHEFQMNSQTIMNRFPKDFERNSTGIWIDSLWILNGICTAFWMDFQLILKWFPMDSQLILHGFPMVWIDFQRTLMDPHWNLDPWGIESVGNPFKTHWESIQSPLGIHSNPWESHSKPFQNSWEPIQNP